MHGVNKYDQVVVFDNIEDTIYKQVKARFGGIRGCLISGFAVLTI